MLEEPEGITQHFSCECVIGKSELTSAKCETRQSLCHVTKAKKCRPSCTLRRVRGKMSTARKVDIIYNTTLVCPWDCDICCVDAVHVKKDGKNVVLKSHGLTEKEILERPDKKTSVYDVAAQYRQKMGLELCLARKKTVIDHLAGFDAKVDISGGDALSVTENMELLKYASSKLGRSNVTLTVTGAGSSRHPAQSIAPHVGEFNFTFDAERLDDVALRPDGYASGNLKKATKFAELGIPTRAEVPLTKAILNQDHLHRLYMTLNQAGIGKLLLMRLFPVGRGSLHQDDVPSVQEYRLAIDCLEGLGRIHGRPVIKLQCALKHLDNRLASDGGNPCDLVRESYGLMADGTLLASPWAINRYGRPLSEEWVLGNLAESSLHEILDQERVKIFARRGDENHGHCKIFAYLYSQLLDPLDRIFDLADPLYAPVSSDERRGSEFG